MEELGRQWKEISNEIKKEYHDRALGLREEYKHAVCIYRNRGPGGNLDDPEAVAVNEPASRKKNRMTNASPTSATTSAKTSDEGGGDVKVDLAVGDTYTVINHRGRERTLTRRAITVESEESDAGGECDGSTLAIKTKTDIQSTEESQPSESEQQPDTPVAQTSRKTKRRHESTSRKKLRISRSPTPILDNPTWTS
ncbi:hypothetical protein HK104_006522 [Borealophlyctis nickersoniae]|nr:hypothetical protein HK104_006522 [Borealophlyctis nickersoniae]